MARVTGHPIESLGVDQHDPNAVTFSEPQKILRPPVASLAVEENFLHGGRVLAQAAHHRVKTVDDAKLGHPDIAHGKCRMRLSLLVQNEVDLARIQIDARHLDL
jgi:hypothetical protein